MVKTKSTSEGASSASRSESPAKKKRVSKPSKEVNYIDEARKELAQKDTKVQQQIALLTLTQPAKKSRKALAKLIKQQAKQRK